MYHLTHLTFLLSFNWNIVDMQYFRFTPKWFKYMCIYMFSCSDSFLLKIITRYWIQFLVLCNRALLVTYFTYVFIYLFIYLFIYSYVLSHVRLSATPWTVAHQARLSMGFPRQEYWRGLPFPSPGHLPNPGIEPGSPVSPVLAGVFFTTSTTWEFISVNPKFLLYPSPFVIISLFSTSMSLFLFCR